MEKQKHTRRPKKSASEYLDAFKRIKMEIDLNPKVKTSRIANEIGISHYSISKLKQLGIINESEHGLFWIGIEPTSQMVNSVKSLFNVPSKKKVTKTTKGTSEPKNHAPQRIMDFESVEDWNKRVSEQISEVTIKRIKKETPVDSSFVTELIDNDVLEAPQKQKQKRTAKTKEKIFEVKIFGFVLFTMKY